MSALTMLLVFAVAIVIMVLAISRWHVHPFLAIIFTAIVLAVVVGIPLTQVPETVGKGFSSVFTSIGLVIIFGTLIGTILEKSGAAVKMATVVQRAVGKRHPRLAMLLIGWIVSIPVFCDSGFVIVNPIRRQLARQTGTSSVALTLALSAGLFASHVFIPPTPGPVAAAGMLGVDGQLLLVIGIGVVVSLVSLVPAYFFAGRISHKIKSLDEADNGNEVVFDTGDTPSGIASFGPIILPILLMAMGSAVAYVPMPDAVATVITFLGKPVIALIVGFLCSLPLLRRACGEKLSDITNNSLKTAGPIIFITAAGSVLGTVIAESGFVDIIKSCAGGVTMLGVFFPFIIAAVLKSAQGSSTVAITTTASIMGAFSDTGSMMQVLGFNTPMAAALVVMAIGAGAMTVSHANDSYFWVVTGFGGIKAQDGYRTHTLMTLLMGVTAIIMVALLSLILL